MMTRKQKKIFLRILVSATLLAVAVVLPLNGIWRLLAFLVPYLLIGWDILFHAVQGLRGELFNENFLMAIATVGALCLGEYPEAVFVMLFYQVGELFQSYAVGKSRRSIAALMEIRPDSATVLRNGQEETVLPEAVLPDEEILVRPGEKIPLDGIVTDGVSSLNTVALTGESVPRDVNVGDRVVSGCLNLQGFLRIRVTGTYAESTVARILQLMESSASNKAKSERFITRFSRWYTPAVVGVAVLLAVLMPLITGDLWTVWLERALLFLVVSCPCALVISVPLSFFSGIGGASKQGILMKGAVDLERLARADTVVFDKTGTLTYGVFRVTSVSAKTVSASELLRIAAIAERGSDHPIAVSLREACGDTIGTQMPRNVREVAGHGLYAEVDGDEIAVGNPKLMAQCGISCAEPSEIGTAVHVAKNGIYQGYLMISDTLKPDATDGIAALRTQGIARTVMLTGDRADVAESVANTTQIDGVYAELLPADKVEHVQRLQKESRCLVFVGDGINDAPVLACADVGIAMGAFGSDAAMEAADVVLMDDKPSKVACAIAVARKTVRIVRQNIVFALAVKLLVMLLGAMGHATMWMAVFADVGVSVLAILNAMRAMRTNKI